MKPKRHTPAPIIRKLRTAEQLLHQRQLVGDVCRNPEVFAPAYHRRQPDQCPLWLQFLAEKCERVNAMASSCHTPLPPPLAASTARPPGGAHGCQGDRLSPRP
jgi:hypothetical protein